jgi:signal transduction histidine kinase
MDLRMPQGPVSRPPANAPGVRLAGERFVYSWLTVLAVVMAPLGFAAHWTSRGAMSLPLLALCCVILTAVIGGYRLVLAGRSRAAALLLSNLCWLGVTVYAFASGYGLSSAVIYLYIPAILYAALLLGMPQAVALGLLTLAALCAMFVAQETGVIPGIAAAAADTRPLTYFMGIGAAGAATVILALAYRLSVDGALRALDASHRELEAAHADLAGLNVTLEKRVATRTRELEETIRELEAFNYSVAHDLRAPLRAINAYATQVQREGGDRLDPTSLRRLDRMAGEAQRMDALLSALLDLGRIGRRPLAASRVDLSAAAHRVVEHLRQNVHAHEVHVDIEPDLVAEGDAALLEALLQSLLDNAFKFTRYVTEPHVEFGRRIAVGRESTERGEAFFVRDNGIGFDPAHSIMLFRPFHRLHNDARFEGLGAGLASARRIVERHGGEIWAEGRPDAGATFYFTLPGARAADAA